VALLAVAIGAMAANGSRQARIGLVLQDPLVRCASDPFQCGAYRGLVRAARDLHVGVKAVAPDPTRVNQFLALFSYFAVQRYDLVIALGVAETLQLSQAARRFPHQRFALLDATRNQLTPPWPPNVEGTDFHTEQASYLAGFLAARMADRSPPPHEVSTVGAIPIPPVQAYIAGFQAGAKRADPKIKLLNAYSNDFVNTTACKNAALDQIAHGSRVVFAVAGPCGLGALNAAKRQGVYGVDVDTDQSYLGKFILTSVIKNLNAAVYDVARLVVHGRLRTGGNLSFDLRNHGVYLGRFSPKVPRSLRQQLIPLARAIVRGKIVVPRTLTGSH
jgi:basic membrane protein A and related proteins